MKVCCFCLVVVGMMCVLLLFLVELVALVASVVGVAFGCVV